jgi:predicted flap endonuclease-1-like 5' DNA nuclease
MPKIRITDAQRDRLEALREELEAEHAGPYGTVRVEDAMEYLLDLAEAADGVDPGSVGAGDGSPGESDDGSPGEPDGGDGDEGRDLTAVPGIGAARADALRAAGLDDLAALRAADPDALATVDGIGEERAAEIKAAVDTMDLPGGETGGDGAGDSGMTPAKPDDGTGGSGGSGRSGGATAGGGDQLSAMMNLLSTHDDRWREADGDARYEVDLPNGGVETAQTKDDVKAVLFRNY